MGRTQSGRKLISTGKYLQDMETIHVVDDDLLEITINCFLIVLGTSRIFFSGWMTHYFKVIIS